MERRVTCGELVEDGESQWRNLERKFGFVKLEKTVSVLLRARMTQEIFVGHHDRTRTVLWITKNGVVRGKNWTRQTLTRCLGIDGLGGFVWYSVADGGSRIEVDEESHS